LLSHTQTFNSVAQEPSNDKGTSQTQRNNNNNDNNNNSNNKYTI